MIYIKMWNFSEYGYLVYRLNAINQYLFNVLINIDY